MGMVWCPPGQNGGGVCTWPPEAATSSGGGVCTERQTSKSEPVYLPSSVADKISPNLALSERLSEVSSAILARRTTQPTHSLTRDASGPATALVGAGFTRGSCVGLSQPIENGFFRTYEG